MQYTQGVSSLEKTKRPVSYAVLALVLAGFACTIIASMGITEDKDKVKKYPWLTYSKSTNLYGYDVTAGFDCGVQSCTLTGIAGDALTALENALCPPLSHCTIPTEIQFEDCEVLTAFGVDKDNCDACSESTEATGALVIIGIVCYIPLAIIFCGVARGGSLGGCSRCYAAFTAIIGCILMIVAVSSFSKCRDLAQDFTTYLTLGKDVEYGIGQTCALVGTIGLGLISIVACLLPASTKVNGGPVNGDATDDGSGRI